MNINQKCVNALRSLGVNAIDEANSGHPGIVLGAAPIMYTLFTKHLNISSKNKKWINRDRFILAAGHGSALYYSMLHLIDYGITMSDLKEFRQYGSHTPGHPEKDYSFGIDATSGPLGQGIAMGVGMSIASLHLRTMEENIDNYTYVLCGDGDLQEGVTQEAMSLAGHLAINNLIVLYDSNDIQLDTPCKSVISENIKEKYEAMNWAYLHVDDGEDLEKIDEQITLAKTLDKPVIIEIKTTIGLGSSKANTSAAHGAPLGREDSKNALLSLGYNASEFSVGQDVYTHFKEMVIERGNTKYDEFEYSDNLFELEHNRASINFQEILETLMTTESKATRVYSGMVSKKLGEVYPYIMAGSADVGGSTNIVGVDGNFTCDNRNGRNILYGVREHAMGAIGNGITLFGYRAIVSCFFVFSDYLKPAMRMAAIMDIPTIFAFTHDSIAVGEDGATHQPIEQLAGLRAMPNFDVYRPADFTEVVASYEAAFATNNPVAIVLTRQALQPLDNYTSLAHAKKGAYIIRNYEYIDGIIIASGSELQLALEAGDELFKLGFKYRIVSMLSMDVFNKQEEKYKNHVLPRNIRNRIGIEMAASVDMKQYIGLDGLAICLDKFGHSGKADDILTAYGFTTKKIVKEIVGRM